MKNPLNSNIDKSKALLSFAYLLQKMLTNA